MIKVFPIAISKSYTTNQPILHFVYNSDSVYSKSELAVANEIIRSYMLSNFYSLPFRIQELVKRNIDSSEEVNYVVALSEELQFLDEDYNDFYHHFDIFEQALFLVEHYRKSFEDHEGKTEKQVRNLIEEQQRKFTISEKIRMLQKLLDEDDEELDILSELDDDAYESSRIPLNVRKIIKSELKRVKGLLSSSPEVQVSRTYIDNLVKLPWRLCDREILDINRVKQILDRDHFGLEKVKERIINFLSSRVFSELKARNSNFETAKKEISVVGDRYLDLTLFSGSELKRAKFKGSNQNINAPILTFVGPPGVGKTSLARSIAEALGRRYIKISLGGARDESDIRGHRRTYVSAMPGKIIKALLSCEVSNPVILLDEIDKIIPHSNFGDIGAALLEVLDPEQNSKFQDTYLEVEYDLSKVFFIATANYRDRIPEPLLDRVEIIELSTYTPLEKVEIAKKFIIPKILRNLSLPEDLFRLSDEDILSIIKGYTWEAGVRSLQRRLNYVAQQAIAMHLQEEGVRASKFLPQLETTEEGNEDLEGSTTNQKQRGEEDIFEGDGSDMSRFNFDLKPITIKDVLGYLKAPIFRENPPQIGRVGTVNGLAYNPLGGSILPIETITYPAKENSGLTVTGLTAKVMRESAIIAHGFVKGNAKRYGINDFEFNENQVHFHAPEGATPKDGPSAGVTFVTSLISHLKNHPISNKIAMTGEITLTGNILQIGGLKEKTLAAQSFGIQKVFIPKQNEQDIAELPKEVRDSIEFIPVSHYNEIFDLLFKQQSK